MALRGLLRFCCVFASKVRQIQLTVGMQDDLHSPVETIEHDELPSVVTYGECFDFIVKSPWANNGARLEWMRWPVAAPAQ